MFTYHYSNFLLFFYKFLSYQNFKINFIALFSKINLKKFIIIINKFIVIVNFLAIKKNYILSEKKKITIFFFFF